MEASSTSQLRDYLPDSGTNFLWAVTGIFLFVFLIVLVFCFTAPEPDRIFHYLNVTVLLVGSIIYFAQASQFGWITVPVTTNTASHQTRHLLYYAKYIYYVVAWPSISLSLGLLSNLSWVTILTNIAMSWIWVLTYLAGALVSNSSNNSYKWGFFAFGTFTWLILTMSMLNEGREAAERIGMRRDYLVLAGWASLVLLVYPIAWAVGDGSHAVDARGGVIFFGVLDILLVPVLSLAFLWMGRRWDYNKLNLALSEERYPTGAHDGAKGSQSATPASFTA